MSKIVKSVSVVDDRPPAQKDISNAIETELKRMPVIKRQMFSYRRNPYADQTLALPDKKGYIDELNRVKVEIAQAKAELRSLGRQVDEALQQREEREDDALEELSTRNMLVAEAEAERLIAEAKENIANMMADYEKEIRRMAEEAKNNGYLEGFDKGFAQAQDEFRKQCNPKIRQIDNLLEQISAYMEEMIAKNERDLLDLAMTVSEKIIGREIKDDPRAVVTMLYQTLDANRREENLRITLSPDLMPVEAKVSAEVRTLITQTAPNALIYVDEDVGDGHLAVETGKGITDMSVKTQLDNIAAMLRDEQ